MKYYTWKDIDRYLQMNKEAWHGVIADVDAYPNEIVIYYKSTVDGINAILEDMFPKNYLLTEKCFILDINSRKIPVSFEEYTASRVGSSIPLFKKVMYSQSSYPTDELPPIDKPVIAFHSYKGGVGRTLSLLSFAKAWSANFPEDHEKLLIIDSDIEAPGLTWLQGEGTSDSFSYLDLLTLVQDNSNVDEVIETACSMLGSTTLAVDTDKNTVEHYFIPTYRYKEQLLDLYASPDSIVNRKDKAYVLASVISGICKKLGLSAALVDLRAGISEFSSTLLLDPRVKKYLVTSTSTQSINGTQIILEYLLKGLVIKEDTQIPEIFLSMVPNYLPKEEKNSLYHDLLQYYEDLPVENNSTYLDNIITELPFASELIHLSSLKNILNNLNDREMYQVISEIVSQRYSLHGEKDVAVTPTSREELLNKIHTMASDQLTAEGNANFDMLMTTPIKNLCKKFQNTIPATVIMGAKGSGKTFLFRKFTEAKDWKTFYAQYSNPRGCNVNGYFVPVFTTRNVNELMGILKDCIRNVNRSVDGLNIQPDVFLDNQSLLDEEKNSCENWLIFWEKLLASSLSDSLCTLDEASNFLSTRDSKVIFILDGLEETLRQVVDNEKQQEAIRVLCQDVVNRISSRYNNLGIIVFLRRDMAHDAIKVNFEQFLQMYERTELKWSSNEALRLVIWLVNQADNTFFDISTSIDAASHSIIDQCLTRFWGIKLGKPSSNEAYSSRWILAALSDFNGQLQARDVIRFLKHAAKPNSKKPPYEDRILMPSEIKEAVSECSIEKIAEVKTEYAALNPILEKLDSLPPEHKTLPLKQEDAGLNTVEEKSMIQEGYLKKDGSVYYLPEIIRHALNFKYQKGARPKVLSLILKH